MIGIGVVGCGYWGPNLVRNFSHIAGSNVVSCCDLRQERLDHMTKLYPTVVGTRDFTDVLDNPEIDAVGIATPVSSHYELGKKCLEAGKHILVEKPLAASSEQANDLVRTAKERGLVLMVGHTFVYTAAVNKMKELIREGHLGDVYYFATARVNLGLFQEDINVVWDLTPHDVSILNYVLESEPNRVYARGRAYIQEEIEDVAFVILEYPNNVMAHIHVSWLDPCKIRRTTVVGSKKMLVYDDVQTLEKIRVYDKGVTVQPHYDTFGEFQLSYRFGDIFVPRLDDSEPLKIECSHFLDCITNGQRPRSDGPAGLSVVRVLEACCESLRKNGEVIELEPTEGLQR